MQNNSKRRLVLLGLENPDGSIDGEMQALEVQSAFAMKPAGDTKDRDVVRPTMSKSGSRVGAKNWDITLPLELKGGGLGESGAINPPPLHSALLACGMVREPGLMLSVSGVSTPFKFGDELTNSTTSDVVGVVMRYVPSSDGEGLLWLRDVKNLPADADELIADASTAIAGTYQHAWVYRCESDRALHRTATVHAHLDGQRRIATRTCGTWSFEWTAGEYCTVQFSLKGIYESPANVAIPSAEFDDIEPPIGESAGLVMADYPAEIGTIEKLSFDLAADVQAVPDINSPNGRKTYRIADRKPTGSIDPETVTLDAFNPFALWEGGEKAAISATLGNEMGFQTSLLINYAKVTEISDNSRAGSDVYGLSFEATGSKDDEFYLIFH
ncbi:hypothetical protein BFW38_06450 [Terasakiispira papahanaumokuakeensis]|uniref:Phage tail protein n=1 Tax=Terasakiispira papahanaumokuakeensis TaxID=197479 RepID=A0A1E2V999_9GAMM|nr:phage tail tube protein [Terasakiispira papahanaumokuakeensis]ODC03235.1 hypothetical protein BFW38_06450 [Terasakiispira papahanaumokuakeensis]